MDSQPHQDADVHRHGDTHGHGTLGGYIVGFLASAVLTAAPFWLVMSGALRNPGLTALVIVLFAVTQIVVHVRLFLNVDTRGEGGWTLVSFIFTAIIVVIMIGGSIWAMYQMNSNMMPMPANMMAMP